MNIIEQLEKEQIDALGKTIPDFAPSDTVKVSVKVGEGVERVFPLYSPLVAAIDVVRRGKVRRAKLYYLRDRRGKSARIAEKSDNARGKNKDAE